MTKFQKIQLADLKAQIERVDAMIALYDDKSAIPNTMMARQYQRLRTDFIAQIKTVLSETNDFKIAKDVLGDNVQIDFLIHQQSLVQKESAT